jgi:hypothetical protein
MKFNPQIKEENISLDEIISIMNGVDKKREITKFYITNKLSENEEGYMIARIEDYFSNSISFYRVGEVKSDVCGNLLVKYHSDKLKRRFNVGYFTKQPTFRYEKGEPVTIGYMRGKNHPSNKIRKIEVFKEWLKKADKAK